MIKKKKQTSTLCKVKQRCYFDIKHTLKFIKLFQDYIDEYNDKHHKDEYSHVKFATMVIHAYESNLVSLSEILAEIDPKFMKKLVELYLIEES